MQSSTISTFIAYDLIWPMWIRIYKKAKMDTKKVKCEENLWFEMLDVLSGGLEASSEAWR
jgi:hypothetical protein